MNKFLKLTRTANDEPLLIAINAIDSVYENPEGIHGITKDSHTLIITRSGEKFMVKEGLKLISDNLPI